MTLTNKTYQPVQSLSIRTTADLPAFRFINFAGGLCVADSRALGVTDCAHADGDLASVVSLGTVAVETSGAITLGADVSADADGKAKLTLSTEIVNGRALEACSGVAVIRIKLLS